jgi:hypothetical protein
LGEHLKGEERKDAQKQLGGKWWKRNRAGWNLWNIARQAAAN